MRARVAVPGGYENAGAPPVVVSGPCGHEREMPWTEARRRERDETVTRCPECRSWGPVEIHYARRRCEHCDKQLSRGNPGPDCFACGMTPTRGQAA